MQRRKKIIIGEQKQPSKLVIGEPEKSSLKQKGKVSVFTLSVISMVVLLALISVILFANQQETNETTAAGNDLSVNAENTEVSQSGIIRNSIGLEDLFRTLRVKERTIAALLNDQDIVGLDSIFAGHKYKLTYADSLKETLVSYEYHLDESEAYKVIFRPIPRIDRLRIPVEYNTKTFYGVISENIWLEILENPILHHELIPLLESAVKWTVDVFHLNPGDEFKLVYRERIVGGKVTGIEALDVIHIKTFGENARLYELYMWEVAGEEVYLDQNGASVESRFLKAPVKFAIVSSPYNRSRRHPVTGEVKPHNGTDYAAPQGAPIFALADGIIEKARRLEGNNGNNVRIIHDQRYKTQYLHMSDFANGISRNARVRQGQIIGYVGQTGQATGPHVCLRFWDNMKQVDFLANKSRSRRVLSTDELDKFIEYRDDILLKLDRLELEEF